MPNKKIKVIFVGAELAPLIKVGGLGDVMGSLPPALVRLGVEMAIFIPFYGQINKRKFKSKLLRKNFSIEVNNRKNNFDVYESKLPQSKIKVFLIKNKIFDGLNVYVGGRKYFNKTHKNVYSRSLGDVERFMFFSKAVIEAIKILKLKPDVIHTHDWHTAMIPSFIDEYSIEDRNFKNIKSLYTIHNLANQGISSLDILDYGGLHHDLTPALMEDYYDADGNKIYAMKVGILSADFVSTVSPTYAKEILTKEYGAGLEKYLNRRKKQLFGILNGIDIKFFNPVTDKYIKHKYSIKNFSLGKAANKQVLQKVVKLPVKDVPLFGLVSRLVDQKGLDILIPALEKFLHHSEAQVVVLGTGNPALEKGFEELAKKYPDKLSAQISFDVALAQKIYAGSDFFLMPSRFEPCGLGQMIAMRYGTLPIVRATGGLKDTVANNRNGLVFKKYNQTELKNYLYRALHLYENKVKMNKLIKRAMQEDFSWDASAKQYLKLYNKLR